MSWLIFSEQMENSSGLLQNVIHAGKAYVIFLNDSIAIMLFVRLVS